jgi:hypothetical protein
MRVAYRKKAAALDKSPAPRVFWQNVHTFRPKRGLPTWMQWLLTVHVNGYRKHHGGSGH